MRNITSAPSRVSHRAYRRSPVRCWRTMCLVGARLGPCRVIPRAQRISSNGINRQNEPKRVVLNLMPLGPAHALLHALLATYEPHLTVSPNLPGENTSYGDRAHTCRHVAELAGCYLSVLAHIHALLRPSSTAGPE